MSQTQSGGSDDMGKKRNNYSPQFKAKVALEALKNEQTSAQLSAKYGVHPTMISSWKKALLDGASDVFAKGKKSSQQGEADVKSLYEEIGRLKVERDFLSRKLNS